jgi:hypothetical protein
MIDYIPTVEAARYSPRLSDTIEPSIWEMLTAWPIGLASFVHN